MATRESHDNNGKVFTTSSKFQWVIDIFGTGCKNVGDLFRSSKFTTMGIENNIDWHMSLYPKGISEENKDYFSLYIHPLADGITARVTIELINSKNQAVLARRMKQQKFSKTGLGYPRFVSRKFIYDPANDVLNDDKITIVCNITFDKENEEDDAVKRAAEIKDKKNDDILKRQAEIDKYEALINDDKFSDMSLISEGKTIKVHKCILSKSSPVFAAMFDADMKENQNNVVEIIDVKHDVLLEMVRFIYTGKVKFIDSIAAELAEAADKYSLDGLKEMSEETMCKNLNIANAISYLEHADIYCMVKLKETGIKFIIANADEISSQEEFELMPSPLLCEIFRTSLMLKPK